MRITIFGASGGVGRELVQQALDRGHAVRAVVRGGAPTPVGAERTVLDDLTSAAIADAIRESDVVLSALGLRRKSPANPWSKIVSPVDLTSRFAGALVQAVGSLGRSPRVTVVSAAGVGDSRPRMSGVLRWMFDHSNVGVAYQDLERMENVLRQSSLDWTAVRPVTLNNRKRTERVREVDRYGAMAQISRADVAWWMLECVKKSASGSRTPMISN